MRDVQLDDLLAEAVRIREEFTAKLPAAEADAERRLAAAVSGAIGRAELPRVIEWLDARGVGEPPIYLRGLGLPRAKGSR